MHPPAAPIIPKRPQVRRAAERQAADLCVTTSPPNRQYKVVRGLRPVPHLRLGPAAGQSGYGSLFMVTEAKAGVRAAGGGPPGSFFMSQPSEEAGVTAVLSMVHARWQGLEGGTAAAYRELLRVGYPSLPDSWAEEVRGGGWWAGCVWRRAVGWRLSRPGLFACAAPWLLGLTPARQLGRNGSGRLMRWHCCSAATDPRPAALAATRSHSVQMAAQLAVRPLYDTGMQVHASQLHAPGVVLLGDAGHAVSPATSNGMNSALEDVLVLSQVGLGAGLEVGTAGVVEVGLRGEAGRRQAGPRGEQAGSQATQLAPPLPSRPPTEAACSLAPIPICTHFPRAACRLAHPSHSVVVQALEACGGDLAALPERYTAARLEDAHALQWMDRAMSALAGRGGAAAALKASLVARVILSKATGGWVRPHAFVLLKDGSLPYGEAARQVRRDAAVAKLVATGLGVALVAAWLKGKAH